MSAPSALPDSNQLAVERTLLAHERTLMAWIRTATAMISFGFTIYKFFQFEAGHGTVAHGLLTPRQFALTIVSIALVSLLVAALSDRGETRRLRVHISEKPRSLAPCWQDSSQGLGYSF
jgi:putative membrane protein